MNHCAAQRVPSLAPCATSDAPYEPNFTDAPLSHNCALQASATMPTLSLHDDQRKVLAGKAMTVCDSSGKDKGSTGNRSVGRGLFGAGFADNRVIDKGFANKGFTNMVYMDDTSAYKGAIPRGSLEQCFRDQDFNEKGFNNGSTKKSEQQKFTKSGSSLILKFYDSQVDESHPVLPTGRYIPLLDYCEVGGENEFFDGNSFTAEKSCRFTPGIHLSSSPSLLEKTSNDATEQSLLHSSCVNENSLFFNQDACVSKVEWITSSLEEDWRCCGQTLDSPICQTVKDETTILDIPLDKFKLEISSDALATPSCKPKISSSSLLASGTLDNDADATVQTKINSPQTTDQTSIPSIVEKVSRKNFVKIEGEDFFVNPPIVNERRCSRDKAHKKKRSKDNNSNLNKRPNGARSPKSNQRRNALTKTRMKKKERTALLGMASVECGPKVFCIAAAIASTVLICISGISLAIVDINRYNFSLYITLVAMVGLILSIAFCILTPDANALPGRLCRRLRWRIYELTKARRHSVVSTDILPGLIAPNNSPEKQRKSNHTVQNFLLTAGEQMGFRQTQRRTSSLPAIATMTEPEGGGVQDDDSVIKLSEPKSPKLFKNTDTSIRQPSVKSTKLPPQPEPPSQFQDDSGRSTGSNSVAGEFQHNPVAEDDKTALLSATNRTQHSANVHRNYGQIVDINRPEINNSECEIISSGREHLVRSTLNRHGSNLDRRSSRSVACCSTPNGLNLQPAGACFNFALQEFEPSNLFAIHKKFSNPYTAGTVVSRASLAPQAMATKYSTRQTVMASAVLGSTRKSSENTRLRKYETLDKNLV